MIDHPSQGVMASIAGGVKIGDLSAPDARKRPDEITLSKIITIPGSYNAPAAPSLWSFLKFEAVQRGKVWEVLRLSIAGDDPSVTVAAATAYAAIATALPQDAAAWPSGQLMDPFAFAQAIPSMVSVARLGALVKPGERVIVGIKSLPANQTVRAFLAVVERDMEAFLHSLSGV